MGIFVRLLVVAAVLAACGAPAATGATSATVAPPPANEQIYVATDRGISVIGQSGATLRELPRGVPAPDWSAFYVVEPGNTTIVRVLDPVTGAERRTIKVPGRYDLSSAYRVAPSSRPRRS